MIREDLQQHISLAADLIGGARRAVALTGAGFSTPSGIPDFRSDRSGLWTKVDPMEVASLLAFRRQPQRFYEWFHELAATLLAAEPNAAHLALAELERSRRLRGVVTQNIDGLHQRGGSKVVCEVHGNVRQATCIDCFGHESAIEHLELFVRTGSPPRCAQCGGFLKPDVILFGEQLPHDQIQAARKLFRSADLVLVGGSSLEVTPIAEFPYTAVQTGARLLIVNRTPTYLDERADVVIHADVAEVFPQLVSEVLHG